MTDEAGYGEPGFAERYDRCRPRPPVALPELLPPLAGVRRPHLVVDIGSGTGLSTRIWAGHATDIGKFAESGVPALIEIAKPIS